jgi:hypothetical protein
MPYNGVKICFKRYLSAVFGVFKRCNGSFVVVLARLGGLNGSKINLNGSFVHLV